MLLQAAAHLSLRPCAHDPSRLTPAAPSIHLLYVCLPIGFQTSVGACMFVCRAGQPASTLLPAMQHASPSRVSSTRAPVLGCWQGTAGPEGPGRAPCLLKTTAQQSTCQQAAYMHVRLDRDSLGRRATSSGHGNHTPPQDYLLAHKARPTAE